MDRSDIDRLGIGPVKKFGRYTLIKKLATGGMAEIWLARQTGLAGFNRFVVIKKILSHLGEEETFVKMFLDEARMSVQLTHPNIVQVYDLGEAEKTYFIAMEYIAGENLAAIAWRGVKRRKPLSPHFAARVIADACRALHYAHHLRGPDGTPHEIVHRDISPQNILVTYEGEVKVVDFGIAKAATKSQHTKTGMLKGKFSYMSPEQCLGNPLDMRSDIFALGIVLYELCTGKRLFKHESELMILEMITKRRITPPSQVAEGISPQLEAIILKALEKEVADRYQTAQDLAIALEDYLRSEAEQANNADIASYMRSLFKDKIEEKQEVCKLAERDDFLSNFEDEEPTEQGLPRGPTTKGRRVIYGNAASQSNMGMPVPGQLHPSQRTPGMVPYPGMSGYHPGMPLTQTGQNGVPFSGLPYPTGSMGVPPLPPDRGLAPKIVIVVALVVIGLASAFLFKLLQAPSEYDQPVAAEQSAPVNTKTGKISITSVPAGAEVVVNDEPVKLDTGETARTPIASLTELQYGKKYKIQLRLEGHRLFAQDIVMSESSDGMKIEAALEPFKGEVRVKIAGSIADQVEVYIQSKKVGTGPTTTMHPQGTFRIEGRLTGYRCKSEPEEIKVQQHSIAVAEIHCDEVKRPMLAAVGSPGPRSGSGSRNPRPPPPPRSDNNEGGSAPPARSGPPGCQKLEGHFGQVTISSEPYSVIYLDDKMLGETPLAKVRLPAGCMYIRAVHPETKKEKTMKINVEPNKNSRYKITL